MNDTQNYAEDALKRGKSYDWIPLWIDKWLMGSTRFELEPAERAVFIDFMVLAAKDDGYIRANSEMGYPPEYLAQTLNISRELLCSTIEKCIQFKKMESRKNGIFYIKNWKPYSLSSRHKRRIMSANSDMMSAKADTTSASADGRISISICISFNFKSEEWEGIGEGDIIKWKEAFPACDIEQELKKMASWLIANPKQRKSNYRRFIHNWLTRAQDRGGTRQAIQPKDDSSLTWAKKRMAEKQHD